MPQNSLRRSLSMRVMGLNLPKLMKTKKLNQNKPSIPLPKLHASNVKKKIIIQIPKEQSDTQMMLDGQEV